MLSLNKRCGFPFVCLMENSDLLMMVTSGKIPPLHVLPQPSSLRPAVLKLCPKSSQRTRVFAIWHFLQRRKDISFPARAWWGWQRKAHSSFSRKSRGSCSPGGVCADWGAHKDWYRWGSRVRGQGQGTVRVTPHHPSMPQPVQWEQKIWMGIMLFASASIGLTFHYSGALLVSAVLDGIMYLLITKVVLKIVWESVSRNSEYFTNFKWHFCPFHITKPAPP